MTISNDDIEQICKKSKIKLDYVISKDLLKEIPIRNNLFIIMNMQNSSGSGTHWVAIVVLSNKLFYFDSFGCIPPIEVLRWKGKYKLGYSNFIIQDLKSTECGLYCIAFLHYIQKNKGDPTNNYNDFINLFEDTSFYNDAILFRYFKDTNIKYLHCQ